MIRTFSHELSNKWPNGRIFPVINGLTDFSHPCQALADYLTILERKEQVAGMRVAYIGDGNNVAHSLLFCGAQLGAHVRIATPPGYEPNPEAVRWAREHATLAGGSCLPPTTLRKPLWAPTSLHRCVGQHGTGSRAS